MELSTLRFVHVIGIMLLFYAFGALIYGSKNVNVHKIPGKRFYLILHGIGLLALISSGVLMLNHLHLGFPIWAKIKFGIWLFLGASGGLVLRRKHWLHWFWLLLFVAAGTATHYGIFSV